MFVLRNFFVEFRSYYKLIIVITYKLEFKCKLNCDEKVDSQFKF